MKNSNELLYDILGVLSKISTQLSGTSATSTSTQSRPSVEKVMVGGIGTNISEIVGDKEKNANVKDTAESLKILSDSLSPLSAGLWKFGMIPKPFRRSIFNFMKEMLDISQERGIANAQAAKTVSESINILSQSLPKLAKGVLFFGIMTKAGLTSATSSGMTMLGTTLAGIGNPATLPLVLAGAAAMASIGVALQGVAAVLKSISLVMLSFSASIVLMVGAIWLATKAFNVSPLGAMGIIVGSIAILAGGFALIGLLSPLIIGAGAGVAALGTSMMLVGLGMLALVGSLSLANIISGSQEATNQMLISSVKSIALMGLAFAALGILAVPIALGGMAVKSMGTSMLWIAGGLLALGGSYALIQLMGVNYGQMVKETAFGILALGGAFALIGLMSPFIILGSIGLISISLSLGLFALLSLGIGAIVNKLGGEEGIKTMSSNITLLVGGVIGGVIKGISTGLLGEDGGPKNFFGKMLTVGKNVATLIGGIFLLIGVSYALGMFAFSLRAFSKAGIITDTKGKDINVIKSSENIARSIGAFFTTLRQTFKDPRIIPNQKDMEEISTILLGRATGFKFLGMRIVGERKPGLIDAISKFAEVIAMFAKFDQIPVYDVDDKGNTKVKSTVKPVDVANNIVKTLKKFFEAFKDNQKMLDGISMESGAKLSNILLGSKWTGALGYALKFIGVAKDSPGLLTPIMKFTETIMAYAKMGAKNELATEFDKNGKPTKFISVENLAKNMVVGIVSFMRMFNAQMTMQQNQLTQNTPKFTESLEIFRKSFDKLSDLGKNLEGINKLSVSIGNLATNIERLSGGMSSLDANALTESVNAANNALNSSKGGTSSSSGPWASKGVNSPGVSNDQLESLATMIANKINSNRNATYDFIFHDTNKGKLEIKFN